MRSPSGMHSAICPGSGSISSKRLWVFQGPEDPLPGMEPSVIVSIGYDDAGLLDQVRARMIDLSVLFAQDELHEVSKAEDGAVLGEVSADGTIVALASEIGTSTLSRDEIDDIRKQAGFAGMAIADGEIIAYDPDNDPEAFAQKTSDFARIAGERQEGAGLVRRFRIRLGRFGRDDSQNERVSKYGRAGVPDGAPIKGRVRSELIRRLPSLVDGSLFAAPDKRSYFTAADPTPRQVALQMRIADEFDAAPVMDRSPETFQAYRELAEEVAT